MSSSYLSEALSPKVMTEMSATLFDTLIFIDGSNPSYTVESPGKNMEKLREEIFRRECQNCQGWDELKN